MKSYTATTVADTDTAVIPIVAGKSHPIAAAKISNPTSGEITATLKVQDSGNIDIWTEEYGIPAGLSVLNKIPDNLNDDEKLVINADTSGVLIRVISDEV